MKKNREKMGKIEENCEKQVRFWEKKRKNRKKTAFSGQPFGKLPAPNDDTSLFGTGQAG